MGEEADLVDVGVEGAGLELLAAGGGGEVHLGVVRAALYLKRGMVVGVKSMAERSNRKQIQARVRAGTVRALKEVGGQMGASG